MLNMSIGLPVSLVARMTAGFAAVILMIWMNELLDLPHHLFGAAPTRGLVRFEEAAAETAAIAILALAVLTSVYRRAQRVAYLESLVVLCAWCRRVRLADEWVPLERFLKVHQARTSHGLCPDCEDEMDPDEVLQDTN